MNTATESTWPHHQRSALLFLILLIAADFVFVALHVANNRFGFDRLFNLELDRGYPELYQYIKLFWICVLLAYLSWVRQSVRYIAWLFLFAYFLLDDYLQIHETAGGVIAASQHLEPHFGLRPLDYGELAVSAGAGMVLLVPLLWAYSSGSSRFRKTSHDLAALVMLLVFFGVVVDMFHIAINYGARTTFVLGVIEDGGEMLSVSLILWYVYLSSIRARCDRFTYLHESVWLFLRKRIEFHQN